MRDLNALATFVAVVNSNSFSLAAERRDISKALVSKHIQELEASVGTKLLNRSTRKLGLTQAGEQFYTRCARLVADAEDAIHDLENMSRSAHGLIRVSTAIAFGRLHLLPAIADFLRENPSVQIDITLSDRFADLVSSSVDVVVRMADEPRLNNLVARKLAPVMQVLAASPAYLESVGPLRSPADLLRCNCLLYAGVGNREWRLCGPEDQHLIKVSGNFRANTGDGIAEAALAGLGVAMMPTFIAGRYLETGELTQVLPTYRLPERTLYAAFLPDRNLPARIRTFVRFLTERFGTEPYWDARPALRTVGKTPPHMIPSNSP
jgi:LysR family transcriptional regulator for bpeEF and oprC